jgi:tRNA(fMet)-specific endonuclease VapC
MKMYVFDTDHLSLLQREEQGACETLVSRLSAHEETDFWVAIVSFHEQFLGWHNYLARAAKGEQLVLGYSRFQRFLTVFPDYQIFPFGESAAEVYTELRKQRIRVGTMDLRIASIAIANNMTLLTRNTIDFQRVPGLTFEDWTQ